MWIVGIWLFGLALDPYLVSHRWPCGYTTWLWVRGPATNWVSGNDFMTPGSVLFRKGGIPVSRAQTRAAATPGLGGVSNRARSISGPDVISHRRSPHRSNWSSTDLYPQSVHSRGPSVDKPRSPAGDRTTISTPLAGATATERGPIDPCPGTQSRLAQPAGSCGWRTGNVLPVGRFGEGVYPNFNLSRIQVRSTGPATGAWKNSELFHLQQRRGTGSDFHQFA